MNVTASTSITSPRPSSADSVVAVVKRINGGITEREERFIREAFERGPEVGYDPFFVCVQAIHETGWFSSSYWDVGNSGGIGISYSGKPSPFTTSSGEESAQIHLANLIARCEPANFVR